MADLNLIVSQIRQRLEILYQEIDRIEGSGGGGSPEDAYTKEQADALFVKKVAGKGLSTNDFTNAYMNQIGTNTTNIANLALDVNSIFEQEGFTATQGSTLPEEITSVLAKHRPFFMNGRTWYFLSESGGVLDYFAIDNNTNGYPELHYARIQESNRNLTVLEKFGTDTTPIEDSENFITSGGVYSTKAALETLIAGKANASDLTNEVSARQAADTTLQTAIGNRVPLQMGTIIEDPDPDNGVYADLFTLPIGKYYRQSNVANVLNKPADLTAAFYCLIENTISNQRKKITLYPATASTAGSFYTCTEFSAGYGSWYKFEGTVVAAANTNANLTTLKSASLDVENPEDELF